MGKDELREIERRVEQGELRRDDLRRLIHAVKALSKQLDEIQQVLGGLMGRKH